MLLAVVGRVFTGRQLAEASDVDSGGGQDMLQVGFGLASVAAVVHAVAMGELADGALDAGSHRVALVPGGVLLTGAITDLQFEQFPRGNPTVRLPTPGRAGTAPW